MTTNELYDLAQVDNIPIYSYDLKGIESLSLPLKNKCFIAIDPMLIKSYSDEKVKLAHELGHCETGSFYNEYTSLDIRGKHERRADCWAIKKLIPKEELEKAYKNCRNRYELSEYFGVTEDFMQKALEYYFEQIFQ